MSFLKDPNSDFPDVERRHFRGTDGPRAASSTLGPGLLPVDREPEAWGHHINRTHRAHQGNVSAVSPSGGAPLDGEGNSAGGIEGKPAQWQTSYEAQSTRHDATTDDVGKPTRRRGKKIVHQHAQSPTRPMSFASTAGFSRLGEEQIHDGTSKNSSHIPGYSGHIPASDKEKAYNVSARANHDKALFMENYAAQMRAMGHRL